MSSAFAQDIAVEPPSNETTAIRFQLLNKITTQVEVKEMTIGDTIRIANLDITPGRCWKAPIDQDPESKALFDIWEEIPGEELTQIFHGWMFASSPSLSALEHPVYDIRLLGCI